ncbi:hypothetical protein O181_091624 [Austropuccinia psidii MF-1]|uniref:Integrase catalytic domain-containing protein n=1 Tax=Austropuccinia psidii MF-1 TaxID=1389203 RepID=A0A9Q3IXQ5_9BASI|nr:hypothetical protein [Austropuccinia psidii MF-1]
MDIYVPVSPLSRGRNKYIFQLIDGYSRMRFIFLLKSKSESFDKFVESQRLAENQTCRQIKTVVSNNRGEFVNSKFKELFSKQGIIHQPTAPYTPQKNPISERGNRTLFEKVRVMLQDYQVPSEWWGEESAMATFILNKTPSYAISFQTPISRWNSLATDLSILHPFGCLVVMHVPKERQASKANPTGVLCMMVGITEAHHNYRLFNPLNGKIHVSHDCTFLDAAPTLESSESAAISGGSEITPVVNPACDVFFPPALSSSPILLTDDLQPRRPSLLYQETNSEELEILGLPNEKAKNLPKGWTYNVVPVNWPSNISSEVSVGSVPETPQLAFLVLSSTTLLVLTKMHFGWTPPKGGSFPFRMNSQAWSITVSWKRSLTMAHSVENLDFHETFAPTGWLSTLRFLLGYCAAKELDLHQMDVKTAFLHGKLEEDLHIWVPEGYTFSLNGNVCLKLKKSLYGLRQSPRNWYLRIKRFFEESGFRSSAANPCLFICNGEDPCFVFLHVDYLVIGGRNLKTFWLEISLAFDMKDLGELRYLLGMKVERDREKCRLFLSQGIYINNLLATFGMQECKSVSTPQVPGSRLLPRTDTNAPVATINYQCGIGLLSYLVT